MEVGASVRWVVRQEQIDPDRWAKAVIAATRHGESERGSRPKWWVWPAIGLLAAVLAALSGLWVIAAVAVPVLALVVVVLLLMATAEQRLADQLERTPSAREGFTFVASPTGTSRRGPAGSEDLPWSRYRAIRPQGDVVTLLLDNGTVTVLPVASLDGAGPEEAVGLIGGWIAGGRANRGG